MNPLAASSSLYDLRRQSELPSPHDLKDYLQDINRRPSWLGQERETCQCCTWSPRAKAYKNVVGAGLSFMCLTSALVALVSLQSSLNDEDGLGLATLAIVNFSFLISGLFVSTVIRILGTKYTAALSYALAGLYIIANFYPRWYTLVPVAVLVGIGLGPQFASLNIHITTIAIRYAPALKENPDYLVSLFTGIHTMFFKFSYIPGNLATTIILFSEQAQVSNSSDDTGIIDTSLGSVCNNTEAATLDPLYVYILLSIFVLFDLLAIIICLTLMDHLGTETRFRSFGNAVKSYLKKPIVATFKMFADWKIYMIIPMMILDGFLSSFVLGNFAKVINCIYRLFHTLYQCFYVGICIRLYWCSLDWFVCHDLWYMQWSGCCNWWPSSKMCSSVHYCLLFNCYTFICCTFLGVLGENSKLCSIICSHCFIRNW